MRILIPNARIAGSPVHNQRPNNLLHAFLLQRIPLIEWLLYFSFLLYSLAGLYIFFTLVQPWINGDTWTRVGADSDRYWFVARMLADPSHNYGISLVSFNGNFLGPVLVALLLKYQILVVLFNYLIFFLAIRIAASIQGVRAYILVGLLMMNLETAVTLITLNKEIFGLFSAILLAKYFLSEKRPMVYLVLGLVTSFATRWEQAAIVLLVILLTRKKSFFAHRHRLALVMVVLGITIGYGLLARFAGYYLLAFTQYVEGANTIVILNHLQAAYGFPFVVLPKILMNLLGELLRPDYYFGPFWETGFMDLHSQIVLPLFSMALVALLFFAFRRGKLAIHRPIAFLIAIYLVGTAVTPFIQPRYEYFVYVLLCVELARTDPTTEPQIA